MKQLRLPWGRVLAVASLAVALSIGGTTATRVSAASSTLSTSPVNIAPAPTSGSNFTITVTQNSPVLTTGTQTDLYFNPIYFQINAGTVVYGADYLAANWVQTAGTTPQTLAQAVTEANTTGHLKNVAAYVNGPPGTATLATGPHTFFTVQFQVQPAYSAQPAFIEPAAGEILDANGVSLAVSQTGTTMAIPTVGGVAEAPDLPVLAAQAQAAAGDGFVAREWWGAAILTIVVGAATFIAYRRLAPGRNRR